MSHYINYIYLIYLFKSLCPTKPSKPQGISHLEIEREGERRGMGGPG
jgi:hypothetical protein